MSEIQLDNKTKDTSTPLDAQQEATITQIKPEETKQAEPAQFYDSKDNLGANSKLKVYTYILNQIN